VTWIEIFALAAKFAPLATVSIALVAAIIAWCAIRAQRDIARRRAAVDFFLKTELDETVVKVYHKFQASASNLNAIPSFPSFAKTDDYKDIRSFLNICELIATGINYGAFSSQLSWAYWGNVLLDSYKYARPLIDYVRATPSEGAPETYLELERICTGRRKKVPKLRLARTFRLLSILSAGASAGLGWWAATLPPLVIGSYWQLTAAAAFALFSTSFGVVAFWIDGTW
jgi:hypothetical protein